jgi:hypothetical protein
MAGEEVRGIIDSMDALQQRLREVNPVSVSSGLEDVQQAKRTLLGKEPEFALARPVEDLESTVKKSADRAYLKDLVAEADKIVAMLAANN